MPVRWLNRPRLRSPRGLHPSAATRIFSSVLPHAKVWPTASHLSPAVLWPGLAEMAVVTVMGEYTRTSESWSLPDGAPPGSTMSGVYPLLYWAYAPSVVAVLSPSLGLSHRMTGPMAIAAAAAYHARVVTLCRLDWLAELMVLPPRGSSVCASWEM